tara:strand:+ start:437 stop:3028 length:2592 start_codon:yes stop_codon:yes gene_type:complete
MANSSAPFGYGTSRTDDTEPYKRKGPVSSQEKMFAGSDGTGLSFRWVMQMAGERDLTRPYVQHPYVHACVNAIAKAVSTVPLVITRAEPGGATRQITEGPLYRLLQRPNALMSQRKFLKSLTQTQQLYGETFLIMMSRQNGVMHPIQPSPRVQVPEELWPVRGDLLEEVIDEQTQMPVAWTMYTERGQVSIPAESLVHIAEANPYSPIRGVGPMASCFRTAAKDFVIDRYDEALLQNGGSPGGILSVDGHLTDADQRAIKNAWRDSHERTDQHRKTAVLPQGTTYKEVGFSPQEMEFREMREWDRETIMSVFGVTKPILGLTEGLNYASSTQAFRSFYEVTVLPFLAFIADELQTKFIHRLTGADSSYTIEFDTDGVAALREDIDAKVDRTIKLFTQGGRSFHEAAALSGWNINGVENGDEHYLPTSLQPTELSGIAAAPPMANDQDEDLEEFEPEEGLEDEDATKAVDPDRLDEVYRSWRGLVNMSANELRTWSENPCSRKASLNPSAVINRNLRLLETKKADWDGTHVKAANRAISFISRMSGMPQGDATEDCPSKRDISLKNWAYNPSKKSGAPLLEREEKDWPHGLETPLAREKYWREWDTDLLKHEELIARAAKRVLRDLSLKIRATLRDQALELRSAPPGVKKQIFTEAEIARLLNLNMADWERQFQTTVGARIVETMVASAEGVHLELTGGMEGFFLTATDPKVLAYIAEREWILAGVPRHLVDEVQRNVVRILAATEGQYGSLREAIFHTLGESEAFVNSTIQSLGTRASLIARTETTAAANYGRQKQMEADGIKSNIWLAKPSARPHHLELNGNEVPIGEDFGYNLRYPGDPSGKASDTINCRCVLLPGSDREQ